MQGKDGVGVPVKVLVDSQLARAIVYNQIYLARSQQILARCHFDRDRVFKQEELYLVNISTGIWERTC